VSGDDLAKRHPDRADMRAHDDIGVLGRHDVRRRPHDILDTGAGIVKNDLDLSPKNATAPVDLGSGQQGTVGTGGPPESRGARQRDKVRNPDFLAIATPAERARRFHRHSRTLLREPLQQPFRRHRRFTELPELR